MLFLLKLILALIWLNDSDLNWVLHKEVTVAFLWGQLAAQQANGTLVRLPQGFNGQIVTHADEFRAVVIKGQVAHKRASNKHLSKGSYFGSRGSFVHHISTVQEATLYLRHSGKYQIR